MAKERSYDYFWNSHSDRYYDAESMGDWLRPFFKNGIFNGQMQVTANDNMSVTIAAGYGYINGKHRHFLTPTTLDLEVASGTLDRIDSVILRRNDTERQIYLVIEKGGNAKSPIAPAPIREGAIYDLKLAEIYIAAGTVKITQAEITDTRMNSAVCGWVAATVTQIDFTQIQAQFDAYFTAYRKNILEQYQNYIAAIQSFKDQAQEQYDLMVQAFNIYAEQQETDFEEWRQNQEQGFNNWYLNNTAAWTHEFLDWFDGIKGALGTDPAGALQYEIELLQNIIYSGEVPAIFTPEGVEQTGDFPEILPNDTLSVIAGKVTKWQQDAMNEFSSMQNLIDTTYASSNGYTDTKIAELINGAPSTLDTLGEIATAMLENKNVVEALNEAIGKKAAQSELDTHVGNNVIHITNAERTKWNDVIANVKVLNDSLTETKKSVSDGKKLVADAVTAKGVTTATNATFATIATNISKIQTGTDTSDATAIASQILRNKTAYVKGVKVTGTMWDYSNDVLKVTPSSTQTGISQFGINPGYHTKIQVDASNVYSAGITYADGRTNSNSANYKSGYNAGYSSGQSAIRPASLTFTAKYTSDDNSGMIVEQNIPCHGYSKIQVTYTPRTDIYGEYQGTVNQTTTGKITDRSKRTITANISGNTFYHYIRVVADDFYVDVTFKLYN